MDAYDLLAEYHRRWEAQPDYTEVLARQIRQAPYFLASLCLHAIAALFVAGMLFLDRPETLAPQVSLEAQAPPPEVEQIDPPDQPVVPDQVPEPTLVEQDSEFVTEDIVESISDSDFDSEFDTDELAGVLGLGAGGDLGQGLGSRPRGGLPRGGSSTEKAVQDALQWLADHQDPEGFWDCDDFMYADKMPADPPSDGPGNPVNDVGVTGLALLAFLGNGQTPDSGPYRVNVARGIQWLRRVQRSDGLYGDEVGNPTLYNHAIATMAMGDAYFLTHRPPHLHGGLTDAVRLIQLARNPYSAWRYGLDASGDNDTSLTGWMVFALKTAEEGRIPVSRDAYAGAEAWFAQMTDPATGRTGYALGEGGGAGSRPSRPLAELERFPPDKSEALTAVALLCRLFMTDAGDMDSWKKHENYETLKKQADLCLRQLPVWDAEGGGCDLYYWYYGTFAMNQWGGAHWKKWKGAIEKALLPHQRKDGNFLGSWDPVGPWGEEGGRVYSTAICALMLEVYYRYSRVLGAR